MTSEECNERAAECAANASFAASEPVSLEFLKLAAQWRAMAVRCIVLRPADDPVEPLQTRNVLPLPTA